MEIELLNTILAFFEGLALTISPCIFPVLPIILAGSLEGGKRRPLGIITGFIGTFTLFTLFSRKLVQLSGLNLDNVRNASFILLLIFGIIMMSDFLTEKFNLLTARLANTEINTAITSQQHKSFFNGLLFGSLIGLIWTPCAGPILASVILQTVLQKTNTASVITILSFGFGVSIPMLAIVFLGREIKTKLTHFRKKITPSNNEIKKHKINLRKILGFAIMISVSYMYYGYHVTFTTTKGDSKLSKPNLALINTISPIRAPNFAGISEWINSPPLQISQLNGKVVLVDFWTYSCINCVRTLPYLKDWYAKYHDKGFEIIGVHSPEFDFEKAYQNVQNAVKKYGIYYPVALDNNFITWQNFGNHYWPEHYLIDSKGYIVYHHAGEGGYEEEEHNIRILLGIASKPIAVTTKTERQSSQTPETYLGYSREAMFNSLEPIAEDKQKTYTYPDSLSQNAWALKGKWIISEQKIIAAEPNAAIKLNFQAGKVYAVMGNNSAKPIKARLLLNEKPVTIANGKDVFDSEITVTNYALLSLLNFSQTTNGILEIIAEEPAIELYTFTFGDS